MMLLFQMEMGVNELLNLKETLEKWCFNFGCNSVSGKLKNVYVNVERLQVMQMVRKNDGDYFPHVTCFKQGDEKRLLFFVDLII